MADFDSHLLGKIAALIRYYILVSTTNAGSGHPTSSLSAVELMTGLLFGNIFRYDIERPDHPNNDRLIFSKGHASPLFYSLWAAAGKLDETKVPPTPRWFFVISHVFGFTALAIGLSLVVSIIYSMIFLYVK